MANLPFLKNKGVEFDTFENLIQKNYWHKDSQGTQSSFASNLVILHVFK